MVVNSENTPVAGQATRHSFKRGYMQLRRMDHGEAKEKLMKALGIETNAAFHNRMNGIVEPRVSEAEAIEAVFNYYGITEIWGE